jgi:hypothetical protein
MKHTPDTNAHRYMRWLWCRGDHIVGLLKINSRISIPLVLNEYFGLRFLFLTNPFATLISTIPWQVTKRSTNNSTYLLKVKLKLLEDCSATPDPECGCYCCGDGSNQLIFSVIFINFLTATVMEMLPFAVVFINFFDSYCYGDGSNQLIFVTRIKCFF